RDRNVTGVQTCALPILEEEFAELMTKTDVLKYAPPSFQLLETIGLNNGQLLLFEEHMERLGRAAAYFQYPLPSEEIVRQINTLRSEERRVGKERRTNTA